MGSGEVVLLAVPVGLAAVTAVGFGVRSTRRERARATTGPGTGAESGAESGAGSGAVPADDAAPVGDTAPGRDPGRDGAVAPVPAVRPTLSNPARLVGRVRDAEHEALPGTVVTVTDPAGTRVGRAVCDAAGAYQVELATGGSYVLIATAPGHQPLASSVTVAGDEVRRDLTLSGAGALAGLVTDTTGAPARGASVSVADARGDVVAAVVVDPSGQWSVDDLYPGDYTLVAAAPGLRPEVRSVTVDASRDNRCDLVLSGRGSLTGVVRAAQTGDPLGDASVVLVDSGGATVGETVSDQVGRYGFEGVRAGSYTVLASGYAPAALRVQVGEGAVDGRDVELARDVDRVTLGRHAPVAETPVQR